MDALKALLSGGRVIAFYPELARAVGGINEAIMLQQFMHWAKVSPDGWFWHTQEQIEEETTIKKDAQQAIRKRLIAIGVIEEKREGLPARMYFRIKWPQIANLLSRCGDSPSSGGIPQQEEVVDRNINRNNEMKERDETYVGRKPRASDRIYEVANWYAKRVGGIVPGNKSREWPPAKQLAETGITDQELEQLYMWLWNTDWVKSISLALMASQYNNWKSSLLAKAPAHKPANPNNPLEGWQG